MWHGVSKIWSIPRWAVSSVYKSFEGLCRYGYTKSRSPPDLSLDIPSQFRIKTTKEQEPRPTCTLNGKRCYYMAAVRLILLTISAVSQIAFGVSQTSRNWMKQSSTCVTSAKSDNSPPRNSGSRNCPRWRKCRNLRFLNQWCFMSFVIVRHCLMHCVGALFASEEVSLDSVSQE